MEKKKILVIVDMQRDYTMGRVFKTEYNADEIVNNIVNKIYNFKDGIVYCTLDTHESNYLSTFEGKHFPLEHCIRMSEGWTLDNRIFKALNDSNNSPVYYEKDAFGSKEMTTDITSFYNDWKDDYEIDIDVCGFATEGCVIIQALMLRGSCPEANINIDVNCCIGLSKRISNYSFAVMEGCHITVNGLDDEYAELDNWAKNYLKI